MCKGGLKTLLQENTFQFFNLNISCLIQCYFAIISEI